MAESMLFRIFVVAVNTEKWHDAGTKQQKKNVFNDFIAAGEYLQKNGYTSKDYMALSGRSNGDCLLVLQ